VSQLSARVEKVRRVIMSMTEGKGDWAPWARSKAKGDVKGDGGWVPERPVAVAFQHLSWMQPEFAAEFKAEAMVCESQAEFEAEATEADTQAEFEAEDTFADQQVKSEAWDIVAEAEAEAEAMSKPEEFLLLRKHCVIIASDQIPVWVKLTTKSEIYTESDYKPKSIGQVRKAIKDSEQEQGPHSTQIVVSRPTEIQKSSSGQKQLRTNKESRDDKLRWTYEARQEVHGD
jgi:hypothetical protein